MQLPISQTPLRDTLLIIGIIIITIIIDLILRSFVKVPKQLDTRRSRTFVTILRNTITVIVYLVAAHIILIILGINVTPLLASAGIAGIAIGLGARPLIEDLIAGLFLLTQASIAIGDYVSLADTEGYIENIGFRTLSIRDTAGALHIIPNGLIKQVVNYSRGKANTFLDIPVAASANIDTVLKTIQTELDTLKKDKELGSHISPFAQVQGIETIQPDGQLLVRVKLTSDASRQQTIARKFRYLLVKSFEKNKIQFK